MTQPLTEGEVQTARMLREQLDELTTEMYDNDPYQPREMVEEYLELIEYCLSKTRLYFYERLLCSFILTVANRDGIIENLLEEQGVIASELEAYRSKYGNLETE